MDFLYYWQKKLFDIDKDGDVTAADARLILRHARGIDSSEFYLTFDYNGLKFEQFKSGAKIADVFKIDSSGVSIDGVLNMYSSF